MLAVARYHRGEGELPPDLALALRCKMWHTLPRAGGLREQKFDEVNRMTISLTTYEALEAYSRVPASQIADFVRRVPHLWRIIEQLREYEHG